MARSSKPIEKKTIEENIEYALALYQSGLCNCSQAVAKALAQETELPQKTFVKLSAGYAFGLGTGYNTCGALTSAVMAKSMQLNGLNALKHAQKMSVMFKEKCGSNICGDIKGMKTSKPLCSCEDCIRTALELFYEVKVEL